MSSKENSARVGLRRTVGMFEHLHPVLNMHTDCSVWLVI
jgi:hypothetical protein